MSISLTALGMATAGCPSSAKACPRASTSASKVSGKVLAAVRLEPDMLWALLRLALEEKHKQPALLRFKRGLSSFSLSDAHFS